MPADVHEGAHDLVSAADDDYWDASDFAGEEVAGFGNLTAMPDVLPTAPEDKTLLEFEDRVAAVPARREGASRVNVATDRTSRVKIWSWIRVNGS